MLKCDMDFYLTTFKFMVTGLESSGSSPSKRCMILNKTRLQSGSGCKSLSRCSSYVLTTLQINQYLYKDLKKIIPILPDLSERG